MSSVTITPSVLSGSVSAPPSGRDTVRLIFANSLGQGGAVANCKKGFETDAFIDLGRTLGADIVYADGTADILPSDTLALPRSIRCKTALSARFAAALALFADTEVEIISPPLPESAKQFYNRLAASSGAFAASPSKMSMRAKGPIFSEGYDFASREGAYWASAFLLSCPLYSEESFFHFDDYTFMQPAFRSSLSVLDLFDIIFREDASDGSVIVAGGQMFAQRMVEAEGDWRNASYLVGALLAAGGGKVSGVSGHSSQNERKAWAPLEKLGILSFNDAQDVLSVKPSHIPDLPIDPRSAPALLPLWMALGVHAQSTLSIGPLTPISSPARKRAQLMADCLSSLGAEIEMLDDSIIVHPRSLKGGSVDAKNDCRVAMGLAVAALGASEKITIHNVDIVALEYPEYWAALRSLGAQIELPIIGKGRQGSSLLP